MAAIHVVCDLEPISPRPMLEPLQNVNHHPSNLDLGEGNGNSKEENPASGYNTDKSKGGSSNTFGVGHIEVPDGGHRAWLVVLGGFINFTIGFGLLNSFGIFQARYEHEWLLSTSTITWIGSVQLFLLFLGGIVVGPAFDRWGARPLMLLGTFVCLCSFICTSFSYKFYHYLLAQGFLFGIGNSLLFYPATSAISEWFNKRRALALGIAVSGSSAGGILWPLVVNKLFTVVSGPWVHRINALISIPLLLVACFLVQERKGVAGHDTSGNEIKQSQTSFTKAVLDWRFFFLSLALFFIYCGMLVPFYYIPLYAESHGVSATMSNNLLAIAYSGSVCGRVLTGWIADHVGRFNILFVMALLTSGITISWTWMTSFSAMVVFAIFFGLFSGGLVPLGSACVAQTTPDMGHIGLRIGTMMAFCSFGALAGGPISGAIKDHTNNWVGAFTFSGASSLAGAVLLLAVRFLWQPRWNVIF